MIQLRLFGPIELEGPAEADVSSVLSQSKRAGLLAYLAAAEPRGFHRRDELTAIFWHDRDDRRARRSLRQALYFLRKSLGGGVIVSRGDEEVSVDFDVLTCDVMRFEQAVADRDPKGALELYRGEFLRAFHLSRAPEFERWMDQQRDRLKALALAASEDWTRTSRESGDTGEAIEAARRAVELAPASGKAARSLIELLLENGDRARAVDAYDAFARRLARDYELQPPESLEELMRGVRFGGGDVGVSGPEAHRDEPAVPTHAEVPVSGAAPRAPRLQGRVALVAVLAGILGLWWFLSIAPDAAEDRLVITSLTQLTFDDALELTPTISPDGDQIAYTSAAGLAASGRADPNPRSSDGAPVVVQQVSGSRTIAVTGPTASLERFPRWSPDGSQLIFSVDGRIYTAPALGGTARLVLPDSGVSYPAWSPDGSRLAYGLSAAFADTLFVFDVETQERRMIGPGHWPVWSPDGTRIAYVAENSFYARLGGGLANVSPSTIRVVSAAGGVPTTVVPSTDLNASPAWLPDGRLLFVSSRGGGRDIYVVDLNDDGSPRGAAERVTAGLGPHTISASADGRRVVYSTLEREQNVWSMEIPGGDRPATYGGEQVTTGSQIVEGVTVSPDGRWLAFDSNRSGNQDVYVRALSGGEIIQVTSHPADEFVSGWSPDGEWLTGHGFRNGNRDVYVVRMDGTGYEIVYDAPSQERYPDWSPDGRSIAFSSTSGGPREIYVTSRTEDGTWSEPRHLTSGDYPRWSSDGTRITFADQGTVGVFGVQSAERSELFVARTPGAASAWLGDDKLVVHDRSPDGSVSYHEVSVDDGLSRPLFRFDDPLRQPRSEFIVHEGRLITAIGQYSGDLWVMELDW